VPFSPQEKERIEQNTTAIIGDNDRTVISCASEMGEGVSERLKDKRSALTRSGDAVHDHRAWGSFREAGLLFFILDE
jgi:hypothetical protein